MSIPTLEELYGESFRAAMTATAPDCPSCGEHALVALHMPEVDPFGRIEQNGDRVTNALEVYRCSACGQRAGLKIELDRITEAEQQRENDNAVSRAQLRRELRRQHGFLNLFRASERAIEAEVQASYPRRPDPDLLERWKERRDGARV